MKNVQKSNRAVKLAFSKDTSSLNGFRAGKWEIDHCCALFPTASSIKNHSFINDEEMPRQEVEEMYVCCRCRLRYFNIT